MDEAVVLRRFGGARVMRAQIEHLTEVSHQPNVTVQLLPLEFTGYSAGASGTFTQLGFPESDVSDVVYVEQLTGAMYIDKRDEVDQYRVVMEKLCADSLSPEATRERLHAVLRDV
jgi:hypothetical protein